MINVDFLPLGTVPDGQLRFAVIVATHRGKLVFVRHRERTTMEIPGGHLEPGELPVAAAERELREETGAAAFTLHSLAVYNVRKPGRPDSFGLLCQAEISEFGPLPASEIAEVVLLDELPAPGDLTYPDIQPQLLRHVKQVSQGGITV